MNQGKRFQRKLSQHIKPLKKYQRDKIIETTNTAISLNFEYFLLVVLSCTIATLGLINDSPAVIIGAMLVAPLMPSILCMGLGLTTFDFTLVRNSAFVLLLGIIISISLSALITWGNIHLACTPSLLEIPQEILARTQPTLIDLLIALAGGLVAAYSIEKPRLSAALFGAAIATALMPPLSTVGIGIALGRWDIAGGASLLFLINAATIALAAILVFSLEGFSPRPKDC